MQASSPELKILGRTIHGAQMFLGASFSMLPTLSLVEHGAEHIGKLSVLIIMLDLIIVYNILSLSLSYLFII